MATLHIQRIRFCSQCELKLSDKCPKCLKHPTRKPKVIELYDFPADQVIKMGECGGCLLLSCGRKGCTVQTWRHVRRNYASGKTKAHVIFCGHTCSALDANERKRTSVEVPCACGCAKTMMVQPAILKRNRYVYFSQKHHYEHVRSQKRAEERTQSLYCYGKCRGEIQDHTDVGSGNFKCDACKNVRRIAMSGNEVARFNSVVKQLAAR